MKNDIAEVIETAAPTNTERKEDDTIPVKLVDEEEDSKIDTEMENQ